ncbi:MAG: MaoC family dehydratase, partial [Rhabdochlamydiaceae bacterium]
IRLPHPLFVGDTLYAETKILSKRESKSRPEQGIVTVETVGKNQHNQVVISFERTFLIHKRT